MGGAVPVVGAPVVAIVSGIAIATRRAPAPRLQPGIKLCAKQVLQASIVVLGLNLSLHQVLATGSSSLPVLLGTLAVALALAWAVGRLLHLRADLTTLIGVGTGICGASAIAATDAVIGAASADVAYAVATIFTFNVVAVLTYPSLGHLLGLSPHSFGLWAGTAINDTSSVVAATSVFGGGALAYGVVVKLTRTLAIVPICVALAVVRSRRGATRGAIPLRRVVPPFIVGFAMTVALNSAGAVPSAWHHGLADAATWMITAALAGVGLSTSVASIRSAGPRPLVLGAVLWASVGVASVALQAATGTL